MSIFESFQYMPIPEGKSIIGWRDVKFHEKSTEKLISIKSVFGNKVDIEPMYAIQNISGAFDDIFTRERVVHALEKAINILPQNIKIKVWDAYRSLDTQQALFDHYFTQIAELNHGLSYAAIVLKTQQYVSTPSDNPDNTSPHHTGAAVDLTLVYRNGEDLFMGTHFDYFGQKARTDYYENKTFVLDNLDLLVRDNRRQLYWTMINAGFTNYREEWWHYDIGNQFYAIIAKKLPIYGPIKLGKRSNLL